MAKNGIIVEDPFDFLDAYNEQAYHWAEKIWDKISKSLDFNCTDREMISIALASIYSDFLHVSFDLHDDFEEYLSELYGEEKKNEKWELMYDYRKRMHVAMLLEYASAYKIYETLADSVLVEDEDEDGVFYDAMSFNQKGNALSFVESGFRY